MYKNRTMKPDETVINGGEGIKENEGGMNLIKIHYKHIM
jgi:hypothetical protein